MPAPPNARNARTPSRPGGAGISRAALSRKEAAAPARAQGQARQATLKAGDEDTDLRRRAAYRAGAAPVASALGLRDAWHITVGVLLGVPLLLGLLIGLRKMGDSLSAAAHLSEAKNLRSVLICQNGEVLRGDGSLRDLFLAEPVFVCTDWRTLQSLEADEAALKR